MVQITELVPIQYYPEREKPTSRAGNRAIMFGGKKYSFVPHEIVSIPKDVYDHLRVNPATAELFSNNILVAKGANETDPSDISKVDISHAKIMIGETTDISTLSQMAKFATTPKLKELIEERLTTLKQEIISFSYPAIQAPTAEVGLVELTEERAIAFVKEALNQNTLNAWKKKDSRASVLESIDARIAELKAKTQKNQAATKS